MRKVLVVIILLLAVVFVIVSFSELQNVLETLHHSNPWFLVAAMAVEVIWLFNLAAAYRSIYVLMGMEEERKHLFLVSTAANFVNVVAPSAGIGGIAIFVDDANRRNHPTGRVAVVGVLFVFFDYIAFLFFLALGWVVLIRRNNIHVGEIAASLIMLGLAITFAVMIYLGYHSSARLGNLLAWMARFANRILRPFIHREYLSEARAHAYAREMGEGLAAIRGKRKELLWPMLFAINNFALRTCILAFCFLALGTPFTIGTLVGGLSIGYLFLIVSPTPSGLGVVEGVMAVVLNSLRVPLGAATLITLTYRAVTFWFPLAVGAIAFRILQRQPKQTYLTGK